MVKINYVDTKKQLADILTKKVQRRQFFKLILMLLGYKSWNIIVKQHKTREFRISRMTKAKQWSHCIAARDIQEYFSLQFSEFGQGCVDCDILCILVACLTDDTHNVFFPITCCQPWSSNILIVLSMPLLFSIAWSHDAAHDRAMSNCVSFASMTP